MDDPKITRPHRHTVRFESTGAVIEFDVELLKDGIVLYKTGPKVLAGPEDAIPASAEMVEAWLRQKFSHVEVDETPV